MKIDVDQIREDEPAFLAAVREMSEIDQIDMVTEATVTNLRRMAKELPGTFTTMLQTITERALTEFQRKMTLGASPARPDDQTYAIVSISNMRQRSLVQMITVAMISYMYRAIHERTQESTAHMFLESFTTDEAAVVKRFLGMMFEYNPTENIDRLTSEIIAPSMDKRKKKASTATITVTPEKTRVVDNTIRAKAGERKDKLVDRTSAVIDFNDGISVKVDPPVDFYAKFMTYYTSHFDAIHKTAFELFLENRCGVATDPQYVCEEVVVKSLDRDTPEDMSKAVELRKYVLPLPNQQWDQAITVYSPKNKEFFRKKEDAEHELRVVKDRTVSDMIIVETNKPTLTASWAAGRANIIVEDEYAAALLKRFEDDGKLYAQMNAQRVNQSTFLNMIEQGENSAEFYEYLKEVAPHASANTLDEWNEAELRNRYHEWVSQNKIYSNADSDFMSYVTGKFPGRDWGRNPMNASERKQLSREFSMGIGAAEVTSDDVMACEIYEFGTSDVTKAGAVKKSRDYFHGSTDISKKK